MQQTFTAIEKQTLIARYRTGESATAIRLKSGIPRSTFYSWLKPRLESSVMYVNASTHFKLRTHTKRLEETIEVLKKVNCTARSPTREKLCELEKLHGHYNVHVLCGALNIPRGTFYNHIFRSKGTGAAHQVRREKLREQVRQVFDDNKQIFGAIKIRAVLVERGIVVSAKMVAELMNEMSLASVRTNAKRNYPRFKNAKKKDSLHLHFTAPSPIKIWVSATTFFQLEGIKHYICVILDLFSRRVLAYSVSTKHSTQFITRTFKAAHTARQPSKGLVFHSARGVQYTSHAFQKLLKSCLVEQSFSPSGKPCHNAVMEPFFSSLKQEELYRSNYRSKRDFERNLDKYIKFYNTERPHMTLGCKTPIAYENSYIQKT